MATPMTMAAAEFHAPSMNLDSRFVKNTGGDQSNMLSRAKYELISPLTTSDTSPILNLEIYTKFNAKITD